MRELFLMIFVVFSVPLVLKRPWLGIAIYIGVNIIRPEMLFWGGDQGAYIFKVYYALVVIASLLKVSLNNAHQVMNRQYLQMIWLVLAVWVSILLSPYNAGDTTYYTFELLKGLGICAFICMVVNESEDVFKIQNVLLICLAFLGIWGIQQNYLGNERLEGLGGHSWGDSNGVAAVFVLFFPVALAKIYSSKTRKAFWISGCIAAIMAVVIILSKSRGGLLGLVVAVLAFGFYTRSMRKVVLSFALIAFLALPFMGKDYIDRMKTMENVGNTETLESSAKSRLVLWQAGLMVFSDNPLFGTGLFTYRQAKMDYESRFPELESNFRHEVFRTENKKVPHNTYIQVMSECGIFGAIPFFLLMAGGIFPGFRARRFLVRSPEKGPQLIWLSGLCAGVAGFAMCIVFIDALLQQFLIFQLTFIWMLHRSVFGKGVEKQPRKVRQTVA